MNILQIVRKSIRSSIYLKKFIAYYIVPSGLFDNSFLKMKPNLLWQKRIELVCISPDNKKIPRHPDAGKIIKGKQIMHNGLKILLGSYYGPEVSHMLYVNKGVHEPQEEYVFSLVLNELKTKGKSEYTMIELGSFWAFYSMWFNIYLNRVKNYMVEPDSFNIGCGKRNFKENNMKGTFINAFVSNKYSDQGKTKFVSVDYLMSKYEILYLDIIHCDIQGHEIEMLEGSINTIKEQKVGYFFISTHSNLLHEKCTDFLLKHDFQIIASANLDQTFSEDGVLIARSSNIKGLSSANITLRQ